MTQHECIARLIDLSNTHCVFSTNDYLDIKQFSKGIKFYNKTATIRANIPSLSQIFTSELLEYCVAHGLQSLINQQLKFIFHLQQYKYYDKKNRKTMYGNKIIIDSVDRLPLMG